MRRLAILRCLATLWPAARKTSSPATATPASLLPMSAIVAPAVLPGQAALTMATLAATLAAALLLAAGAPAHARGDKAVGPHPVIPFEADRAALRGDRVILRLNDESSAIPSHRIQELPVINGRLGDHAKLDGGVMLWFPHGRILSSEMTIHQLRPDPAHPGEYIPDAAYRHVAQFDRALGPVCAAEGDPATAAGRAEMRLSSSKMITLVVVHNELAGPKHTNTAYQVTSATNVIDMQSPARARALYQQCTKTSSKMARR